MSLHLKVGSDFIHHLEGLIKSVFHGLAQQGTADVKSAFDKIKGHAEDALENFEEKAESASGDLFHLQSHQAAEPEQSNKNANPSVEKANLGVDENGAPQGGPTSVAPLGASVAAQNIQESHTNQHAPDSSATLSSTSSSSSSASEPEATESLASVPSATDSTTSGSVA